MHMLPERVTIESDVALRANGERRSAGVSWSSAAPEVRRGLPSPPERADFQTTDGFEEALSGWAHRVAPVLSIRQAAWNRGHSG